MTSEQLDAMEAWIKAIITDDNSTHSEDATALYNRREELEVALHIRCARCALPIGDMGVISDHTICLDCIGKEET